MAAACPGRRQADIDCNLPWVCVIVTSTLADAAVAQIKIKPTVPGKFIKLLSSPSAARINCCVPGSAHQQRLK